MKVRIMSLFIIFSCTLIILMYKGFMPHPPKLIPLSSGSLSEMTIKLSTKYPQINKIEGQIFNSVLEIKVSYNGVLDDLKAKGILLDIRGDVYGIDTGRTKYKEIEISIFNTNSSYRYATATPLDGKNSALGTWIVRKTEIINNKEVNSEELLKE